MRAILLAAIAGCATTTVATTSTRGGAPFSDGDLLELMFTLREGERRRDPDMAERALRFARSSDRSQFEADIAYLKGVPAGTIRVPSEFRIVCRPPGGAEGDYLFFEPVGSGIHAPTIVTVVRVRGSPRILYEPPLVTEEERAARLPVEIARLAAARRIERWQTLDEEKLAEEVSRLRHSLRYQTEARAYAEREKLSMPPFAPDPAAILADLEGRDDTAVRDRVIALLRGV
jgi:hypothetical protein